MTSKFNQRRAVAAINVGLLISCFTANAALAAECGQAKLVEAGSVGITVTQNPCKEPSRVTVGSVLELSGGSRMWLKFDPNLTGESFQLICQNKSEAAVNVNITSISAPWIKAQGIKNCEPWKRNKLTCESASGEKNSFFCAVASSKPERSGTTPGVTTSVKMKEAQPELTTSVKMRGIILPGAVPVEDIINNIKPDIELCKSLYNVTEKVEMSWTISLGIIKDLSVNSDNQDLVNCVEAVVKQANADQDQSVKHAF